MHHPTDRIAHTTAFLTQVVEHWLEREIAQWAHPMKDRSDDPLHHERTLLPRSYISLPKKMKTKKKKMKKIKTKKMKTKKGRRGRRIRGRKRTTTTRRRRRKRR